MKRTEGALFARNSAFVLAGSAAFAFAIHYLVIPNLFMEGGFTGLSILLHYAWNIPPSLTTLLFNAVLFLLGWKLIGLREMNYSLIGAAGLSFFLWIMERAIAHGWLVPFRSEDFLLTAIYAGLTSGLGLGVILRHGGSTGGSTLVARLGRQLFGWKQSKAILVQDVVVIGAAVLYMSVEKLLYTLVMVYVAARVIDLVSQEDYSAKAITVYSEAGPELAGEVFGGVSRGYTVFEAKRGGTAQTMKVIHCVVSRSDVFRYKQKIRQADPAALIIVHDVQDVAGDRF